MSNNEGLKEYWFNDFLISTDRQKIDIKAVHHYLSEESYWAKNIPLRTVETSVDNSICIAAYTKLNELAAFARIVTDQATFGYLCDVFVLEKFRGLGISKVMMKTACELADEFGLRRFMLFTQDAHGLYEQNGFSVYEFPERTMSRKGVTYK